MVDAPSSEGHEGGTTMVGPGFGATKSGLDCMRARSHRSLRRRFSRFFLACLEKARQDLLEQVAEFEKSEFTSANKKPNPELVKPKLTPLHEGASELLNKEIARLQEENEKLKTRLKTIEMQATTALDEKSKLEKALRDVQIAQGDQKYNTSQDISELENTVADLKCQFEKTLQDSSASQKSLEENLVSAKHDLLKVQDQLAMTEKELEKKFQQTAAYRNMKEILSKKNEQIKELRKKLSKYEPDD
ncbi:Leucine zipper transcription factor-like protein 1 [Varanus komodoensis]|nr:Leucine zipper transcription factor-like protein 1 [Varanus komodoensis]